MRHKILFQVLSIGTLLAGAFLTAGCPKLEDRLSKPLTTVSIAPEAACMDQQWIAMKHQPNVSCPDPAQIVPGLTGWTAEPLWSEAAFPAHASASYPPARARSERAPCDTGSLFLPLECFCRYRTEHEGADLAALFGELSHHGLVTMERDCMAVVPAQAAPPQATDRLARRRAPTLETRFLAQAGRFASLPARAENAAAPVRLAVVDTAPTNTVNPRGDDFNSPHGYVLLHMAGKLLAPSGGPTAARLTSRLTLRFITQDPSLPGGGLTDANGGFFGSIGDLATDLRAEVADWQAERELGGERNLVLNLSLGWNERFNTLAPTAVAAVRAALTDAICRGALPIAAAGNQDWGPNPTSGPLFPAAWETQAAPTAAECALLTGQTPPDSYGRGAYRPLVHAAGAVGAAGARLALARLDAEPRLVAFADHGLVTTPRDAEALTGSSVAALVVSATAAAAWSTNPSLGAFELMDRIHGSSQELGRQADFGLGDGSPAPVRRVFACSAAQAAGAAGIACPGQPDAGLAQATLLQPAVPFPSADDGRVARLIPRRSSPEETSRALADDAAAGGMQVVDLAGPFREAPSPLGCPPPAILNPARPESRQEVVRVLRSGAARSPIVFPCPQWQAPAQWANAWINPQPGSNQCPTCGIEDGSPIGNAYLEIDSQAPVRQRLGLPDPVLSNPVLKVGNTVYLLEELDLTGPRPIRVRITNVFIDEDPALPVFFSVLLDGQLSSTSLLLGPEALSD